MRGKMVSLLLCGIAFSDSRRLESQRSHEQDQDFEDQRKHTADRDRITGAEANNKRAGKAGDDADDILFL